MRKNTTDEQRMRTPFGRYVNTINDETDYDAQGGFDNV